MARDLRLFYLFRLLATSYLWFPVFVHFMISRGLDFGEVTLLAAVYSGVVILVEVPTGALADRIGRRTAMMAGALAMVASCLLAYTAESFAIFAVVTALSALSMSLCSGADSAYLFDLLHAGGRGHEYPRREGTASAWHLGGKACACAAGGLLGMIDLGLPYLVTAGTASLAFVAALFMREDAYLASVRPRAAPARRPVADELRGYLALMGRSIADVVRQKPLLWAITFSAVVFVLLRATDYLYQPFLKERGFGIAGTGLVYAGFYGVAAVVAQNLDRLRRRFGEPALVWGLLGALAASFVLLDQIAGSLAVSMMAVQAVAIGMYSPLVKPILNRQILDSGRRATILSVESIARRVATGAFIPIAGSFGATEAMPALCSALGVVSMIALALAIRHAPRASRPAPGPAGVSVDTAAPAGQARLPLEAGPSDVAHGVLRLPRLPQEPGRQRGDARRTRRGRS